MTKAELVSRMAKDAGISQKSADMALNALTKAIQDSLKTDGQIRIPELGTFKVSKRNARSGVNPRTGDKIEIPECQVPGFTAAKALKESVKG